MAEDILSRIMGGQVPPEARKSVLARLIEGGINAGVGAAGTLKTLGAMMFGGEGTAPYAAP